MEFPFSMNKSKRTRSKRTNSLPTVSLSITALPFVAERDSGRPNYWDVEPADGGASRLYHNLADDSWFVDGIYD